MQSAETLQKALGGDRKSSVAIALGGSPEQQQTLREHVKIERAKEDEKARQSSELHHKKQTEDNLAKVKAEKMTDYDLKSAYLALRTSMDCDYVNYGRVSLESQKTIEHYKRVFAYRGLELPKPKVNVTY